MRKIYTIDSVLTTSTTDDTPWRLKKRRYVINKTPKKCPVCEGSGKYEKVKCHAKKNEKAICHGCDGKGWVVVDESYIDEIAEV